ncbi:porin [Janthinobacterium agaricidamnosum]|uniref:Gram-negative porin family protein n=1 Tax=Janthinobacterium agaricidamnosum NBRC 102515 = DSM 9628 TaxID=1349767 RepID=W0V005_9BURK|nr:porin [Janthinobacterium agaricidamnosum]CDG80930.1 gram-negative porin family protein [Janthinobacterium agaricidamnosum NBRC 102515 = DSM 9628]
MKQTMRGVIALLAGAGSCGAIAQGNVTMYGLLDTGLAYVTNVNPNGGTLVKMPSLTGSLPSRIGVRGTEALDGGLSAMFTLEAGLTMDTGGMSQGNRLFGRQASVGLKGDFGAVTLGRQINMTYISNLKSDVMGPNLFSIGSIDPYLPNARSDNAIGYLGDFNGWIVGATYSTGRDASSAGGPAATACAGEVAGNSRACRQVTGLLGYEVPAYGFNVSYDIMYGNTGAANGLTGSNNSDKRVTANGYFKVGKGKIGAGIIDRSTRAATGLTESDLYFIGLNYPVNRFTTLDTQVAKKDVKNSADDATLLVARLTYHLSKRTALYGGVARMKNAAQSAVALDAGGTVGTGKNQNGVMAGLRHAF